MTTSKFWAYGKNDRIDFIVELGLLADLVGVAMPSDTATIQLSEAIITANPQESFDELKNAVVMACSNKILNPKNETIEHFGKMSLTYIGQVMAAYKVWKQNQKAAPPRPALGSNFQLQSASDESIWKSEYISMLQWIKRDGGLIPPMGNFWQCFQYLKLKGRINPTKDEYIEIINDAFAYVNQEADKLGHPQQRSDHRKFYSKDGIAFKNLCRERYFRQWLQNEFMNAGDSDNAIPEWIDSEIRNIDKAIAA